MAGIGLTSLFVILPIRHLALFAAAVNSYFAACAFLERRLRFVIGFLAKLARFANLLETKFAVSRFASSGVQDRSNIFLLNF